ncbi:MAG TPA: right-handed parallel beta-helix repeat-containing protein, partial [Acidimicrobiales bacterium]|nr:right-handed parallel beta-helix repeat-containing protein [Acidimicrobiales bacterium]
LVQASPCATIGHAASVAASGDAVQVAAGTYDDSVVVSVSNLTITGQGPSTIVAGPATQPAFNLNGAGDSLTMMSISNGGGDGVDNSGNMASFVNDNITLNHGTGIVNSGANVNIRDDSISSNQGGIRNQGNTVSIVNDTIANNRAFDSGGVWSAGTGVLITGDTIDSNQSSGPGGGPAGINSQGPPGSISVGGTILVGNLAVNGRPEANCGGPITDAGYNMGDAGNSCGFSAAGHDLIGQQPNLGFAAWNGGPTQTQAIPAGSPAQGAIAANSPFCNGTDQRGAPRLQPGSAACDMGAFQAIGGYWEVASDGGIFTFNAPFAGSMGGQHLNAPIVGVAEDPTTGGYWEVASDGGVFAFNAPFDGSMGGQHLNAPVVGMAPNLKGEGYWEVAADGGIFAFGGAPFLGSMGGQHLNAPIVGMAADPATGGYREIASDGGIFDFGGADFVGSMGGQHLNAPVVGMAGTSCGYWEVAADGGVFAFPGSVFCAPFVGSMGGQHLNQPIVGAAAPMNGGSPIGGEGYWEVASDGGIFAFNVPFLGSMGGKPLNAPIVGMATG